MLYERLRTLLHPTAALSRAIPGDYSTGFGPREGFSEIIQLAPPGYFDDFIGDYVSWRTKEDHGGPERAAAR